MKVLIVDDNATNRKLLDAILQGEGLETWEAADGLEAMAVLREQTVDAIISDILMPRMDGYRLCFEVRRHHQFSEIPFIFHSSTYTSVADEKLAMKMGANRFLRKPATAKDMLCALAEVMTLIQCPAPQQLELPQALNLMKEYSGQLVAKVGAKNAKLQQRTQELQKLSRRILEVQETEQRHLARELHDEIGQSLSILKLNLEALEVSASGGGTGRQLECIGLVDQVLQQVRSMSLNLRPSVLDDLGLVAALRWYVNQHVKRTGQTTIFETQHEDRRYDPSVETACFRIVQEALTNVVRHARAKRTTISLTVADGVLHLRVHDDGAGFDVSRACARAQQGNSLGLVGMQERAGLAGGHLEFHSTPGGGTEVRARFSIGPVASFEAAELDAAS